MILTYRFQSIQEVIELVDWAVGTAFPDVDMRIWNPNYYRVYELNFTEGFDECFDFVFGQGRLFDIILYLCEDFPAVTIEPFCELIDLVNFFFEKHSK